MSNYMHAFPQAFTQLYIEAKIWNLGELYLAMLAQPKYKYSPPPRIASFLKLWEPLYGLHYALGLEGRGEWNDK